MLLDELTAHTKNLKNAQQDRFAPRALAKSNSVFLINSEASILKGHVRIKYICLKLCFKDRMHINTNKIR